MSLYGSMAYRINQIRRPEFRDAMRKARRGLQLPKHPTTTRGLIWAVAMVKNEADIIGDTVQHLLSQGVDRVLVADNGSTDQTVSRLLGLDDPRILIAGDREVGYFQAEKMTLLARYAELHGARWVVPFDADEFWVAPDMTLRAYLSACSRPIARASMHNMFPTARHDVFRLEVEPHSMRKVAFRSHPLAALTMGNHWVSRPGETDVGLKVLHMPWRSREQFATKVRDGAAAVSLTEIPAHKAIHWRSLAVKSDAELDVVWDGILTGLPRHEEGWWPSGGPTVSLVRGAWHSWPPTSDLKDVL